MKKTVRVDLNRLERFEFDSVKELRSSLEKRPELSDRLKVDFEGTLRDEKVVVDEEFKRRLHQQWRAQIQADIRETMSGLPESKKRYYSRIVEGEPLRLRVEVDRETGRHGKRLREEE
jgi:hypothetical protein